MCFDERSGNFYSTEIGRTTCHFYMQCSSVETPREWDWGYWFCELFYLYFYSICLPVTPHSFLLSYSFSEKNPTQKFLKLHFRVLDFNIWKAILFKLHFLRVNPKAGLFFFDSSFRPVPLRIGFTEQKVTARIELQNGTCYKKVSFSLGCPLYNVCIWMII